MKSVKDLLTPKVFWDILRENWSSSNDDGVVPKITAISVTKVDQGVLSDVNRVQVEYENPGEDEHKTIPPADWLVKFCRPDLNLSWMCQNETIFYGRIAPKLLANNNKSLPFDIPKFLCGSDQHLVLQQVPNIETYPLMEGCPPGKIGFLLESLASLHAACWESEVLQSHSNNKARTEDSLVFPPGMGQRLPPLQKEGLFVESWQDFIDHMRLRDEQQNSNNTTDQDLFDFSTTLCQKLATLKLRDVHDKVHRHRVTCVHGDFHIANWLFPTKLANQKPVLVDFATTGYGNPLVDLVFFMVVSTNEETVSDSQGLLEKYYQLLLRCDPNLKISLSTLREWFPWALVCQFLILVAYDGLCRGIAMAEPDQTQRESQLQHFCNVNKRMLLALRGIDNWDSILSQLEPTTPQEQQEAKEFCQSTTLVI